MGKSSSGPDIFDVLARMSELGQERNLEVNLLMSAGGGAGGLPLYVIAIASTKRPLSIERGEGWSVQGSWPNRESATFTGFLFAMLMRLEALLDKQEFCQLVIPA